ncbi:MAG: hypothetical protein AB1646_06685 [Thermodesulfobacteriota bacterium]
MRAISLSWISLGPLLVLLHLGHGFAGNLEHGIGHYWRVPPGQPAQIWSRVDHDRKLSDPFFNSDRWSNAEWVFDAPHAEIEVSADRTKKKVALFKHTAECTSNSRGSDHVIRICEARLLGEKAIDLLIHESTPGFYDRLRVEVRNGMFACQYWTEYLMRLTGVTLTWTTKRQELTLDKKAYRKGDVIKGRIDFECIQENTTPEFSSKFGRCLDTIKVHGVFKTVVE